MSKAPEDDASTTPVEAALQGRRSIRAYLDRPVPRSLVDRVLTAAAEAPSGSNMQPWTVHVVVGDALAALRADLMAAFEADEPMIREYDSEPPDLPAAQLARRRACGFGLYGHLGIAREDRAGRKRNFLDNYRFFGAPVGLFFFLGRHCQRDQWADCGMFLQSLMLAAHGLGLATCPQDSLGHYPEIVRRHLDHFADDWLVCGMSLGWPDPDAHVNRFRPERMSLDDFVTWHGSVCREKG